MTDRTTQALLSLDRIQGYLEGTDAREFYMNELAVIRAALASSQGGDIVEDALKIAEYIGNDIEGFNRFIEAAKMCGYRLVRDGKALTAPPPGKDIAAMLGAKDD